MIKLQYCTLITGYTIYRKLYINYHRFTIYTRFISEISLKRKIFNISKY